MTQAVLPTGERPGQTGGAEGTRTPDPHTASVVRYQLRHSPLPTRSGVPEPSTTIHTPTAAPGEGVPAGRHVSAGRGERPVQRQVELQHVHGRRPDEAQVPPVRGLG